jgi:predicted permease
MSWRRFRDVIRRVLLFPAHADRDLDDEIRFHLAEEARLLRDRGLSEREAAAAARRAFGNVARAKEDTRAVWVSTALEQLGQDLRFGLRILTKSPGVSATSVALVALVIGGNTTVFSIAHGILTKPSPGVHATNLLTVSWIDPSGAVHTHNAHRVYDHVLERSTTLQRIAALDWRRVALTHENGSHAARAVIASPNYFETLGVRFAMGRSFTAEEAERGAGLVAVIGDHVWQNAFQGAGDVVGRAILLNGQPATIVGVAERGFRGSTLTERTDVWVPSGASDAVWPDRPSGDVVMVGRLATGASRSDAIAELAGLWSGLQRADPALNQHVKLTLVPYSATAGGDSIIATRGNRMLAIFSVVTLLTIAIVCANVTNLLIARAAVRQREMALRQSLGASRARIVRGLLAEGLVLSSVAWIAACLFAWWVSRTIARFLVPPSQGAIVMPDLTPDWTVVGYGLVLALLCTMAITVGPALRTWQQQLLPFLKVGEQGVVQGRSRLSRGLVVLQLALSIVLLTSAGLAYRSLSNQDSLDVGFETRGLLLATVSTAGATESPQQNGALLESIRARLARVPGVDGVSYAHGMRVSRWMDVPVRRDTSSDPVMAADNVVAPGYFATVGVPLVAGGDFTAPGARARRTAIVTQELARALWPGDPPIVGKVLLAGAANAPVEVEIVGVVRDAFFGGRVTEAAPRYIFFSSAERPIQPGEATFYIRHRGRHDAIAPAVARALREAEPRAPIASLRSLDGQIAEDTAPGWMLTTLLALFAGGSLLIASIGQYAVVAFDGRRRRREFGVRIALGASSQQLVASVVAESFRLTLAGLAIGFGLSVAVGTLLARVLFGVTPTDPMTYGGVFVLLASASLLACYLPARRAARTDPLVALRTE